MAMHLSAFYASVDLAGALTAIAAVPDPVVTVSGNDVRVPDQLPFIVGEAALTAATTVTQAQIQSPSLRSRAQMDVEPFVNAVVFGSPPEPIFHLDNPVAVTPNESINFAMNTDAAGATVHYGLVWFGEKQTGKINGDIIRVRATAACALAAGTWVNGALTFGQSLPVGRYQVVGVRARGTNLVAARLVFVGGIWRPGVPAVNAIGDLDGMAYRNGNAGVFGEFHTNNPPTVDCLGVTDTAQTFIFDLVKVA